MEGIAIAAGVPKPEVYVVPEMAPNAFATGRDPEHSSIAVTQGLLDMMNRVELEGVIGHEMSHVLDRDILIGTIVATVVGAAILLSEIFMRSWFWGGGRRSNNSGGGDAGILSLILFAVGIVLLILAPLAGQLIKLSVSRNREYLADAQGVAAHPVPAGADLALCRRSPPRRTRCAPRTTRPRTCGSTNPRACPARTRARWSGCSRRTRRSRSGSSGSRRCSRRTAPQVAAVDLRFVSHAR